jgi:rhodanese-related sulfurtransferase
MNLIGREELKEKLDRKEDIKLVMVLGEWAYRARHIPGSLHFNTMEERLDPDDHIIVYDSNPKCVASLRACKRLEHRGYRHVHRYAGGLENWEDAGYPLEGELVG